MCSYFYDFFFLSICTNCTVHEWPTILYLSTFGCCFPPLTLSHCSFKASTVFMHRNAGNTPFSGLPCQLSAYGVAECVTDFFSPPRSMRAHLILCLQRLVSDASIVVSHIWAKANTASAAGVSVCLYVVNLFSSRLWFGSNAAELELWLTVPNETQTGGGKTRNWCYEIFQSIVCFIFAWPVLPCSVCLQSAVMVKNGGLSFLGSHMSLAVCSCRFL